MRTERAIRRRRSAPLALVAALALALASAGPAIGDDTKETADVSNQGGPMSGVYAEEAAVLTRQTDGISIGVSIPVPQPDTYSYPSGATPGSPEVFTGWAFVFNNPEQCIVPFSCSSPDLFVPAVAAGVYNFAGHPVGAGGNLVLTGHIQVGQPATGPPGSTMAPLSNPEGAHVHMAIAPHGQLNPALMPDQARTPIGSLSNWWIALFEEP